MNEMESGRILVVDDDGLRAVVSSILSDEGYAVEQAASGNEAIRMIEREPPCVVFLDMRMGDGDGWFVADQLTRRGLHPNIVVMTAAVDAQQWAAEIKADAFLAKPFELEDLVHYADHYCPRAS